MGIGVRGGFWEFYICWCAFCCIFFHNSLIFSRVSLITPRRDGSIRAIRRSIAFFLPMCCHFLTMFTRMLSNFVDFSRIIGNDTSARPQTAVSLDLLVFHGIWEASRRLLWAGVAIGGSRASWRTKCSKPSRFPVKRGATRQTAREGRR